MAGKLLVNFDKGLAQTMAEAKALARMGLPLPDPARTVLQQEEKFQIYYETLSHALKVWFQTSSAGSSCALCSLCCCLLQSLLLSLLLSAPPSMQSGAHAWR